MERIYHNSRSDYTEFVTTLIFIHRRIEDSTKNILFVTHHITQCKNLPTATSKPGIRTTEPTLRADHKITTDGQYNIRT